MWRSTTNTSLFSSSLGIELGLVQVTCSDHVVHSTTTSQSHSSNVVGMPQKSTTTCVLGIVCGAAREGDGTETELTEGGRRPPFEGDHWHT